MCLSVVVLRDEYLVLDLSFSLICLVCNHILVIVHKIFVCFAFTLSGVPCVTLHRERNDFSFCELCENEVCFLHILLDKTNVRFPKKHKTPPDVDFKSSKSPAKSVRRVLWTKESDSSFAEAYKVLLSEPTHMEGKDEDQENEEEDGRDKWRVQSGLEERSEQTHNQTHETWMTWCALTPRANVTCHTVKHVCKDEKMCRVRVHTSRRLKQIAISCTRSCYNIFQKKKYYELHQFSFPPWGTGRSRRRMPPEVLIKKIGSCRSSPDSRWRRCIFVSASRKSDRSFIGAFLPELFSVL